MHRLTMRTIWCLYPAGLSPKDINYGQKDNLVVSRAV